MILSLLPNLKDDILLFNLKVILILGDLIVWTVKYNFINVIYNLHINGFDFIELLKLYE